MKFNIPNDIQSDIYEFKFYKEHIYRKKHETLIETEGELYLTKNLDERFTNSISYVFESKDFTQKGIKDPLIFSPVQWILNLDINMVGVNSKEDLKLIWKKYKDKYRRKDNLVPFMALENLYFNTLWGLEYSTFSHSPYLLFFINLYRDDFEENKIIHGLDWVLMPMSIPVNTTFKCSKMSDHYLTLNGWITLDEKKLDSMIANPTFKEKGRSYHYSKDFQLDSEIKVIIDSKTASLSSASFYLEINGEQGKLHEIMKYEIKRNSDSLGKSYVAGTPRFLEDR